MADNILPKYTFLPWLRKGISNQIDEVENRGQSVAADNKLRATVDVRLNLKGNGSVEDSADQTVNLIGPGDIVGINNQAIVRTEPRHWITNFEPNYLASIDFYDEDFVWRYSPAIPNSDEQLRPWLFLVVLKEDEFETEDPTQGVLPSIKIDAGPNAAFLPKYDELDAWAHIHVNGDLDPDNTEDVDDAVARLSNLISSNPNLAVSRIICPRKLEANTAYHAFLIPTYETGRLAGLGIKTDDLTDIPAQLPSWGDSGDIHALEANRWPIYFNWFFKTGSAGDFEYLVRQLIPRPMDMRVGRRPMDIQNAGYNLTYQVELAGGDPVSGDDVKTTLSLEGALTVPGSSGEAYPYPDAVDDVDYVAGDVNFRKQLQDLVNLGEDLKAATSLSTQGSYYGSILIGGNTVEDDPIIAPPLYGRWHALRDKVSATNADAAGGDAAWIHELNLDPRNRVVAGIGTRVVQTGQDKLMDEAWEQLGDVIEANKKLYWAQMARETSRRLYDKHLKTQPNEKIWAMTGRAKRRMLNEEASPKTYYQDARLSQLPIATEDRAMRRLMRPVGPVMKRVDPAQEINRSVDNLTSKLDLKVIAAVEDKVAPVQAQTTGLTAMKNAIDNALSVNTTGYTFSVKAIGDTSPFTAADNTEAVSLKDSISDFEDYFDTSNWPTSPVKPAFNLSKGSEIKEKMDPLKTVAARVYSRLDFETPLAAVPDRIVPVLAYPKYRRPMYETIRDLGTDLLIPNLNLIPNNTISLLQNNQKFIESFMVGLNHEMGRELLWREYPTDQRGSYFRQFWSVADNVNVDNDADAVREEQLYDIPEIHEWLSNTTLGSHSHRGDDNKLVLLIRGDLLKKYPNAVIYAIKAKWQVDEDSGEPLYNKPRLIVADSEKFPIFSAKIDPDITFLGFDLTEEEARGDNPEDCAADDTPIGECDPGYFFVIRERPGEVRFGMDVDPGSATSFDTWNDLHWGRLSSTNRVELGALASSPSDDSIPGGAAGTSITWSSAMNAAEMAMVLYQNPVMVCVHAREMLNNV